MCTSSVRYRYNEKLAAANTGSDEHRIYIKQDSELRERKRDWSKNETLVQNVTLRDKSTVVQEVVRGVPLLRWGSGRAAPREEVVGVLGSSVLLDPNVKVNPNENEILWMFLAGHQNPLTILHHIPHYATAEPSENFKSRLQFFPSNGSLAVNRLGADDQGAYSFTVDGQEVKIVYLQVYDKLLETLILTDSSSLSSTIELTCNVSGDPHQYQWRKDGREISLLHQLMNGNRTLVIPEASSHDCGTYTCVATNPVSSSEANFILTLPATKRFKYCLLILLFCNVVSRAAILIALIYWIALKGADPQSAAVLWIAFFLLLVLIPFHVQVLSWRCTDCFQNLENWNQAVVGLHVTVIIISIFVLMSMTHQNNARCDNLATWNIYFATRIGCAMLFLLSAVVRRCNYENQQSLQQFDPFLRKSASVKTFHQTEAVMNTAAV
ncbi:leucine-rich repeats and immunoglobulin-like domains protein 1 isoform X2 [Pristis pectinata]|uniref:leucine-rich repeats and immunoglobulin-like domains protein 1 isoform X2 n=1 Tax=Pristis pectinata TaxID=685728 RepID=UPI00223D1BC0|nr:leucine-rich repeats and immunoglobulin-like domains protein 1 isoform X2 [Pristis pectinata]